MDKLAKYIFAFSRAPIRGLSIYIEVVPDLTEEPFSLAHCRFINCKSIPRTMISDNATTSKYGL